ncbi:MAG TPA: hypothetical protein VLA84_00740 [Microcoleus sp.]|nr:hypothetical protein [Microcoleus sp.]
MSQTKVKKLTPEQAALIPVYREKWKAIALSTGPINRSQAAETVKSAYAIIGKKAPEVKEQNAEIRRVLIQGIGYDRICQELEATELDNWREYTLLKINFKDDFDVLGQPLPVILLKMTCPSTGFIHALRVPPNIESAMEAIRWVNWGVEPEEFSVQT